MTKGGVFTVAATVSADAEKACEAILAHLTR